MSSNKIDYRKMESTIKSIIEQVKIDDEHTVREVWKIIQKDIQEPLEDKIEEMESALEEKEDELSAWEGHTMVERDLTDQFKFRLKQMNNGLLKPEQVLDAVNHPCDAYVPYLTYY